MRPRAHTIVVAAVLTTLAVMGLVPWAQAAEATPARALVPASGHSVVGDGKFPTVTAGGLAASEYANREWSGGVQNNVISVEPDNATGFGRLTLLAEQTLKQPAQPVRRFFLHMPATGISNFRCDYGPEDPTRASNKNYSRLGAQITILGGKAQLLCFQRSSTGVYSGYQVYTPYACVAIVGGPRYVIDGTGCVADVYRLNKTQMRLIAYNQPFSLYLEADVVGSGSG